MIYTHTAGAYTYIVYLHLLRCVFVYNSLFYLRVPLLNFPFWLQIFHPVHGEIRFLT